MNLALVHLIFHFLVQLVAVKEHGGQLMAANHFEAPKVQQTLEAIVAR